MDETVQFNLRLSKSLIYDMDFIAKSLKINRNDWLKYKLAQMIKADRDAIISEAERDYVMGRIDGIKFKELIGTEPPQQLWGERERQDRIARISSRGAKKYILDIAEKVEKKKREDETKKK